MPTIPIDADAVVRSPITRSHIRDQYILAQALYEGAKALTSRTPAYLNEPSNAHDMNHMLDAMFPSWRTVFEGQDKFRAEAAARRETAK
jgi:hypothetical protein